MEGLTMTGELDGRETFGALLESVEKILKGELSRDEALAAICRLLKAEVPHYDWVGFYLTDPEKKDELVLGPYDGAPTDHTRIPFGRGICGQAAETKETFLVQDVSKETNYLSCSVNVKSEIVVPILRDGEVLGELDVDSHRLSPFTEGDRMFLEKICEMVMKIL
jgi:GAF domain-containing protein